MREFDITVNGKTYSVQVVEKTAAAAQPAPVRSQPVQPAPKRETKPLGTTAAGSVAAPIPGKLLSVRVKVGQTVSRGDLLCIIEAMKMENEVHSPADGTVVEILAPEGKSLAVNEPILRIE